MDKPALHTRFLTHMTKLHGLELRQASTRVGKFALITHQRYAHAKQFHRANKMKRKLKIYLGRIILEIGDRSRQ